MPGDKEKIFENKFDVPIGGNVDSGQNESMQMQAGEQQQDNLQTGQTSEIVREMYAPSENLFPQVLDKKEIKQESETIAGEPVNQESVSQEVNENELPESLRKIEDVVKKVPSSRQRGQHIDYGVNAPNIPGFNVDSVMVYPSKWIIISRIIMWTAMVFFILFAFHMLFDWTDELLGVYSNTAQGAVQSRPFLLFSGLVLYIIGNILITYKWLVMSYEIKPMQVIFTYNGIFRKDRKIYSLVSMDSLNLDQGILGKLFNYGTLHIMKPMHREEEQVIGVPEPEKYMVMINNASQMQNMSKNEGQDEDFK